MQMSRLESIITSDQTSDYQRNIISFLGHLLWIHFRPLSSNDDEDRDSLFALNGLKYLPALLYINNHVS